jgi:hypothetical protein
MKRVAFVGIFFLIIVFFQCATQARFLNKQMRVPSTVAVLPVNNLTVDVDGALLFRKIFYSKLKKKKIFRVQPLSVTDSILNEMGITDGGQLSAVKERELLDSLKVEGIIFLTLIKANYETLGIFNKREVQANARLKTGDGLLWEDERKVKHSESKLDEILDDSKDLLDAVGEWAEELGDQLMEKTLRSALLKHPLRPEIEEVCNKIVKTLKIR